MTTQLAPVTTAAVPPPTAAGQRPITTREFHQFQQLIYETAGIYLSPLKKPLLVGRLSVRLRALALRSFSEYYERVTNDRAEMVTMLDCICTNETHFFREPKHFDLLEEQVFPAWAAAVRNRHIRVWSAACSTGEEPYSLAMSLLRRFPPSTGWTVEVFASDLSTRVLDRAQAALWPIAKSAEIPAPFLKRFMLRGKGEQEGVMRAAPELRQVVRFARVNLVADAMAVPGPFDLIFCRNVLIYFDTETRRRVVERLVQHLAPAGLLFLGHAESLNGISDRVRCVVPTVYAHAAASSELPFVSQQHQRAMRARKS